MHVGRAEAGRDDVAGETSNVTTPSRQGGSSRGAARTRNGALASSAAMNTVDATLRMQPNAVFSGAGPRR